MGLYERMNELKIQIWYYHLPSYLDQPKRKLGMRHRLVPNDFRSAFPHNWWYASPYLLQQIPNPTKNQFKLRFILDLCVKSGRLQNEIFSYSWCKFVTNEQAILDLYGSNHIWLKHHAWRACKSSIRASHCHLLMELHLILRRCVWCEGLSRLTWACCGIWLASMASDIIWSLWHYFLILILLLSVNLLDLKPDNKDIPFI